MGGKLVNMSVDLYLAVEFAERGDLYHMRGQLSEKEARSLAWQLLSCLRYLHCDVHVWHR